MAHSRTIRLLLAGGVAACIAGCATGPNTVQARSGGKSPAPVEQLYLLLTSMAVDLDGSPGPDGFGVRLYAGSRKAKEAPLIVEGTVEFRMFDGRLAGSELQSAPPLKTWRFDAAELKSKIQRTEIGASYRFMLAWGDSRPSKSTVTIVARYEPPLGPPVWSGLGTIPIAIP